MKYLAIVFIAALALAGCQTVTPTADKFHVVLAPESLYNCPVVKRLPKIETLTDLEVARLLVTQAENNRVCRASVDALRNFYNDAKKRLEG